MKNKTKEEEKWLFIVTNNRTGMKEAMEFEKKFKSSFNVQIIDHKENLLKFMEITEEKKQKVDTIIFMSTDLNSLALKILKEHEKTKIIVLLEKEENPPKERDKRIFYQAKGKDCYPMVSNIILFFPSSFETHNKPHFQER